MWCRLGFYAHGAGLAISCCQLRVGCREALGVHGALLYSRSEERRVGKECRL